MSEPYLRSYIERPTIYVILAGDVEAGAYSWVQIGAEEEGVPCQHAIGIGQDAVPLAYMAAQQSRLGVGVGVTRDCVALHEAHMPPDRPVMTLATDGHAIRVCRLIGGNAGRMVKRMPFRLAVEPAGAQSRPGVEQDTWVRQAPDDLVQAPANLEASALAATIARVLSARGVK